MNSHELYSPLTPSIIEKLKLIVGSDRVLTELTDIFPYAMDGTLFDAQSIPEAVIQPNSAQQIQEILKICNEQRIPITPRGSGTSLAGGPLSRYGGIILDMRRFAQIEAINIDNNIVIVQSGVICDQLNAELQKVGYFFPPDPGSSSAATIGGMIANNAGGIQAFKYGVTVQYVLWLEVVLPTGEIIETGSKTLKSTSSYNLTGLMVGSEGTLGIVTKAALKIRPLPQTRKTAFYLYENFHPIVENIREIRKQGILPNMMEFLDKTTTKVCFDYLGGEYREYPEGNFFLIEVDGSSAQVEEDFERIDRICQKNHPLRYKITQEASDRDDIISARKAALPALSRLAPTTSIEDCTINLDHIEEAVNKIHQIPERLGNTNLKIAVFGHLEGNLHPTFLFNENFPQDVEDFEKAVDIIYKEIVIPLGGTITGEHGVGMVKSPYLQFEHKTTFELMHKLKKFFDPNLILNPGKGKGTNDLKYINPKAMKTQSLQNLPTLSCMRCGFCIAGCPGLQNFQKEAYSPRGKLALLRGILRGNLSITPEFRDILFACTLCGACAAKCPAQIDTVTLFEDIRTKLLNEDYQAK